MTRRALSFAPILLPVAVLLMLIATRSTDDVAPDSHLDGVTREPSAAPAVEPRHGAFVAPSSQPALVLPNGDRVRCLNDVRTELVLEWPPSRPYSPIAGRETATTGLVRYVHADGTRSTTQWLVSADGTREPVGTVFTPAALSK